MKKQARPTKTDFSFPFAYKAAGVGRGYFVGTPPCLVVHGMTLKRQPSTSWRDRREVRYSQRGPWVMTVYNTGLAIDSLVLRFVSLDDAFATAQFIVDIAPMLDIPLYSTDAGAVQNVVKACPAFMLAVKDFILKLDPHMAPLPKSTRGYVQSNTWREELINQLRRKIP